MEPLYGGRGCISDSLPVREAVGELTVQYNRRIEYNCYSMAFNKMRFHENAFPRKAIPRKAFPRNAFTLNAGNNDEYKASKPWELILYVGRNARQQLLDISAE